MNLDLTFQFERSTKNTHRYNEVPAADKPAVVGALYIQKYVVPTPPQHIVVTLHLGDAK